MISRAVPPGAARPFAFIAFRLTFLNAKTFDFSVSDLKISYVLIFRVTDESVPVWREITALVLQGRKSRMRNSRDCPFNSKSSGLLATVCRLTTFSLDMLASTFNVDCCCFVESEL